MKRIVTRGIPRSLLALAALGAISGHTLPAGRWQAQTLYGVGGQGYAAVVNLATGTQQFAGAALPAEGGMANADLDNAAVANTFTASTLTSITTGMADSAGASAQTTAEAADVNILNGLITARQVLAVAASYGDPAPPVRRALRPPPSPRAAWKTSSPVPARTRTRSDAPAG